MSAQKQKNQKTSWVSTTTKPEYSREILLKMDVRGDVKIRVGYLNHTDVTGDHYCLTEDDRIGLPRTFVNVISWQPLPEL